MVIVLESLVGRWERIGSREVKHVLQLFLSFEVASANGLPWFPTLHYFKKLNLVVRLVDEFLNKSTGNLLLDGPDRHGLVDDRHAEASHFLGEELISVVIWNVLELLQTEVVKLHKFHSWERFNIEESDAGRKL